MVPGSQEVGSVLRAEVETGLEGIEVLSLSEVKPTRSPEKSTGRIEVVGTPKRAPDVSVILAPGSGKRSRRRDEDGDDRDDRRPGRGSHRTERTGGTVQEVPAAAAAVAVAPRALGAAVREEAPAPAGPGRGVPEMATEGRPEASAPPRRPRPCIATPCWPPCDPSRFR